MAGVVSKCSTIRVSNLPDQVNENDVKIHFQRKKNGGGEVTEVEMDPDSHEALVVFEEEEVAETVLTLEHKFNNVTVCVEKYEEAEDKCDVHEVPKEEGTVLVSELLKNINENDITIHFQRKKNSGGEVKEVKLFSDRHEALVVFEDCKVANAVVKKEHTICGKVVKVELYKDIPKEVECDVHKVPKEERTVLVSELLKNITENDITIHFQRKKNLGGEVKEVKLFSDRHEAFVVFEDYKVANAVVKKEHAICGQVVKVELYKDIAKEVEEIDKNTRTVQVSDLPKDVTKNDLHVYFQERKNGGGEVKSVTFLAKGHALVVFDDLKVAEKVLTLEHKFNDVTVCVEKYEEAEDECDVHKVPKEERTVLVSELLKNITENDITIHFQRKKNSGGEVKEVKLFSDRHEALVVFEDYKVANAVVKKEHTIRGKGVKVELYKDTAKEVEMETGNVDVDTNRSLKSEKEPYNINGPKYNNNRYSRDRQDIASPNESEVPKEHVSTQQMTQRKVNKGNYESPPTINKGMVEEFLSNKDYLEKIIIVSDIPDGITEANVVLYFQKKSSGGGEVEEAKLFSEYRNALVIFKEAQVAKNVVQKEHMLEGQEVRVEEYNPKPKIINVDCVFTVVTATINTSIQNIKPTQRKAMLDEAQEVTGVQLHHSGYGLSITGLLEQVKNADNVLKSKLSELCSHQALQIYKTAEEFLSKEDYLGKTIIVSDIPDGISETTVLLYFQKKCNGGGQVEKVKLFSEHRNALVIFDEAQVAENVVQKEHMLEGQQVRVEEYNQNPKVTKMDCIFALVTATINPSLLENIEPTQYKAMLAETQEVTGIQWHHSAHGLLITGSLEQVKKADDVLRSKFSESCSEQPNAEQHQRWSEIAKRPNAKLSGYQGDSGMTSADTAHDPDSLPSQIIGSNITERDFSHRNTGPSRNFMTEENNQGEKRWGSDDAWVADLTGNKRSRDSNIVRKKPEVPQEFAPTCEHRASFRGSEVNNQDIAKNPAEIKAREGRSIARQSSSETYPRNTLHNKAVVYSHTQELKKPSDFLRFDSNVVERGSATSPQQQTQSSGQHQTNASVDTALPDEYQTKRTDQTGSPFKADRRPNLKPIVAACFQGKTPQNVENNSLQGEATAGVTNPLLKMGLEGSQEILKKEDVAAVEEKDSSDGYFQQGSGGGYGGDLPNDAHDSEEPTAVGYESNQGTSLDVIENAFQQMNLDEESSSTHVAQFILQVYKDDLESFKSQHNVDVVLSQDQKRLTLKPMREFDMSQNSEVERKFQQFYESTSKKLKEVTIDLREFATCTEDIEKMKESMSPQGEKIDVMIQESNRDVYTLIGDAHNVDMFRKKLNGALRKNSPVPKETLPVEPMVASRKGVRVILKRGNIEKEECDAIVNFADKNLLHKTGISSAIKQAAGAKFWSECRDIIAKNGSLVSNMVTITTAGSLSCQHVIHAILPEKRRQENLQHGLQETCRLILYKVKENQMKSICFPVVTPDLANLSPVVSARLLFAVIMEFIEENSPLTNCIEEIGIIYRKNSRFVEEYTKEFLKNFQQSE